MSLDELLRYVQKTNPEMTKEKLIEELKVSKYSTIALVITYENSFKKFSN